MACAQEFGPDSGGRMKVKKLFTLFALNYLLVYNNRSNLLLNANFIAYKKVEIDF